MVDSDATALLLSRLDSIDTAIRANAQESRESRRRMYNHMEAADQKIEQLDARVAHVETAVTRMTPTLTEFVTIKAKVEGAGVLGRALWFVGGVLISVVAAIVTSWHTITAWFRG